MSRRRELTVGDGKFRLDREICGGRWAGIELQTNTNVHVSLGDFDVSLDKLREDYAYEVDGVSECRSVVPVDNQNPLFPGLRFACIELMPIGETLFDRPVPEGRRVEVIDALARTVQRASQQGVALLGLVPELVYVGKTISVMPRSWTFAGHRSTKYNSVGGELSFRISSTFMDPKHLATPDPAADVYLLGLLIVWIYQHEHAYQSVADREHRGDTLEAMRWSHRDPFAGPKPLDELLEQILQPEPKDRIAIDEVVRLLERAH